MKRLITLAVVSLLVLTLFAQAPQRLSYQAVIRNSSGGLVTNHAVGMRISILQGSATGTAVYVETHTPTTNANGLATIEIGGGTVASGTFSGIDWGSGTYYIKTETDPAGGSSYTIKGTSQILSVPYALYSKSAANGFTLPYSGIGTSDSGPLLSITNESLRADGVVTTGIKGISKSTYGIGVFGQTDATTGTYAIGVMGISSSDNGKGVFGQALRTGLHGSATAPSGIAHGVYGESKSPSGYGIYGLASSLTGTNYGVCGETASASGYAGYFEGNVKVTGTLSKGGGSFEIDHPLDPANKILRHSFVESPDMMNVYNGNIRTDAKGSPEVILPDYFESLNRDFRYQLTVIGEFAQAIIAEKISDNRFTIRTDKPDVEVSWQVTGIRKDPWAAENRIMVEEYKKPELFGHYLYPELYGNPENRSVVRVE